MTAFTRRLLIWYRSRERAMPWRGQKDPYKIWLSEVMLQQTQVQTVKSYYEKWLNKFPTLNAVADTTEDEILKTWEGLGYYARARNFQKACRQIVEEFGGKIPADENQFAQLKGVGPYTTAAVLSIAFGKQLPVIDGNVKRVVARLEQISKPPSKALSQIETFLKKHIPQKDPGDFNQAMMDIGATLCRPQRPFCQKCPLSGFCKAFKNGKTDTYPLKEKKKERPHYRIAVGIVWKGNKILVSKRKSGGLLGGLWEFPGGKIQANETSMECAVRELREEVGIQVHPLFSIGIIGHAYTHFSIEMEGIFCEYISGRVRPLECEKCQWISLEDISDLPFPKANHKLFPLVRESAALRFGVLKNVI